MTPADLFIALLVGLALGAVLGLLGGGGGILAVPAFVNVLGMPIDEASTTSLVVVAVGAAAGLIPHAIAGRVDWRIGSLFGALGFVGAVAGARLALVADDRLQLAGLIALIFLAASGMLRDADDSNLTTMRHRIPMPQSPQGSSPGTAVQPDRCAVIATQSQDRSIPSTGPLVAPTMTHRTRSTADPGPVGHSHSEPARPRRLALRLLASATGVGLVTGFFGVGGGFVAVPALIWGAGLPVRRATATGLLVIVINSVVALAARGPDAIAWPLTGFVGGAAVAGALTGALLSGQVPSRTLKRSFGWLLIVVGIHEVVQLALLY